MIRVCVDPGHGGRDPGALGKEADIALEVAHFLFRELHAAGCVPFYTRASDDDLAPDYPNWRSHEGNPTGESGKNRDLNRRAELANQYDAHCFISLHANAAGSRKANGAWVIYCEGSARGRKLAQTVFDHLKTIPGLPDADPEDEVYPDGLDSGATGFRRLAVLRKTNMPAVLVEMGFLTNAADFSDLHDPAIQRKIADAITDAVLEWNG